MLENEHGYYRLSRLNNQKEARICLFHEEVLLAIQWQALQGLQYLLHRNPQAARLPRLAGLVAARILRAIALETWQTCPPLSATSGCCAHATALSSARWCRQPCLARLIHHRSTRRRGILSYPVRIRLAVWMIRQK